MGVPGKPLTTKSAYGVLQAPATNRIYNNHSAAQMGGFRDSEDAERKQAQILTVVQNTIAVNCPAETNEARYGLVVGWRRLA